MMNQIYRRQDGSLTTDDIQDDIDDEVYCADLSDDCFEITIDPLVDDPDFVGPEDVCPGELVIYEILNYDPALTYQYNIISGAFSMFVCEDGVCEIIWLEGAPGSLCVSILTSCGMPETCLDIDIGGNIEIEIDGNFEPCPGAVELYEFEPAPDAGESYVVTLTGGTILSQTNTSAEIEWSDVEGDYELCVELTGGDCELDPVCEEITVELDYEIPDELDMLNEMCVDEVITSSIEDDSNILSYDWSITDGTILSGQGTSEIDLTADSPGLTTVCLTIETDCGEQGPLCEDIDVFLTPEPEIEEVDPTCQTVIDLMSNANPNNDIEWSVLSGPDDAEFIPDDGPNTEATFTVPGIYEIQIIEEDGICQGIDLVTIEILSELIISDVEYTCDLNNQFTATFDIISGDGPYTVNGDPIGGSTFTSDPIDSEDAELFLIVDDIGCFTEVEVEFECPCQSFAGTMLEDPIDVCISDDEPISADWNNDAVLDNNDIGLYYLHDNDDDELGNIIDFNETGEFEYFDDIIPGVTYYVSFVVGNELSDEVNLDDDCLSVSVGQPVTWYDIPILELQFDPATCSNSVQITAEIPDDISEIEWTQVDGPGSSEINPNDEIPTTITVSEQGAYSFEIEVRNPACINFQEIDIDFLQGANISAPIENCNSNSTEYTVTVQVNGGIPPYNFNVPGTFDPNTNSFTTEAFSSGQAYDISLTDDEGCLSNTLSGNKLCDCISDAGNMNNTLIEVCDGEIIVVDPVTNQQLDSDDIGVYILHTLPNGLGQVIDTSNTNDFDYNADIVLDSIYYISFVVGNLLNDFPDVNDPCFNVSNGQPVIWYSIPQVNAGIDQQNCDGLFMLDATPVNGQWLIIDSSPGLNIELQDDEDPNTEISISEPGFVNLQWQSQNGVCTNVDTLNLTRLLTPVVSNISTTCSNDLTGYTVQIDLDPSTGSTFNINGQSFTGQGAFISDLIDKDSIVTFIIENEFGCQTSTSAGPIDCNCTNNIGDLNGINDIYCESDSIFPLIFLSEFETTSNDTLVFVVHDGTIDSIGNIIEFTLGEPLTFSNNYEYFQPYIIHAVIAPIIANEVDLNYNCFLQSNGLEFSWAQTPQVSITVDNPSCIGDSILITFSKNNDIELSYTFENISTGEFVSFDLIDLVSSFTLPVTQLNETWLASSVTADICEPLPDLSFEILGVAQNEFELIQDIEICNNPLFGASLNLNDLIITDDLIGTFSSTEVPIQNEQFVFDNLQAGQYEIVYSTLGTNLPCPGTEESVLIQVIDCNCPSFNFPDLTVCVSDDAIDLNDFDVFDLIGDWEVLNINNLPIEPTINNDRLEIDNASPGIYAIQFTVTQSDFPDVCDPTATFNLDLIPLNDSGQQIEFPSFCDDENADINLFDLIDANDTNGLWSFDGNPIGNSINSNQLNTGTNTFEYTVSSNNLCPASVTTVQIDLYTSPVFTLSATDVLCFGENNGTISINVEDSQGQQITCYVNDVEQAQGKIIDDLAPGTYFVYVENQFCQSDVQAITIEEPDPIEVSLGPDQEVNIDDPITIQAITNILESDLDSISWTDLRGIIDQKELSITTIADEDNIITVILIDDNGCIALDEIQVSVLTQSVYIPNVFSVGDFNNNEFGIQNIDAVEKVFAFRIYDRWGNLVFNAEDFDPNVQNFVWDGRYNEDNAIPGVYVYFVNLVLRGGEPITLAGDITLLK